ncbi:MAG: DMT family transporter [Candidatus Thermoplasmatota archaeon]|nr:DMT family transporter [Candidatus Thermoplasmatota archaeon]
MRQKATIALFLVTIIWGWTFVWLKNALDASAPYTSGDPKYIVSTLFVTLRFGVAVILFLLISPSIIGEVKGFQVGNDGMILALLMTGGFVFQMIGLEGLTPAVSAFLTSLYVLFTALILAWYAGRLQNRTLLLGVVLATFGAGYIQGPPELHYDISEWLTILCAIMFAGHIIATDVVTRRVSPIGVTFTSIALSTIMCILLFGIFHFLDLGKVDTVGLVTEKDFLYPLLLSSVFGTFGALSLVNYFQKYLDPVRAAILYALEPVWATLLAIHFDMTEFSFWLILGGSSLLVGNLIAELGNQSVSE